MKKFIVTEEQLKDVFREGFFCSAEGFNFEYGLDWGEDLLEHTKSSDDYYHKDEETIAEIFQNIIKEFKQ